MMEEVGSKKRARAFILVLIVLAVFSIVSAVKWYLDEQEKKELNYELEIQKAELDRISSELELKIQQIEELGGEVDDLIAIKDSLSQERQFWQDNRRANRALIRSLSDKVDGYEELLLVKDKEIEKLEALNEQLMSENTELKSTQREMRQTQRVLAEEKEELEEKVTIASRLQVENIRIVALNPRGKESESPFRARRIDKIKVEFNIAKNDVAPIEGKNILIRIIDSNDQVLFDVARGSGTFMIDDKEAFYTANQEILFDNSRQLLTFLYDKGSRFEPGEYTMEVYTEGYLMGSGKFVVK
jgi:cell division protein ZapB